jgi:hypothetical protein
MVAQAISGGGRRGDLLQHSAATNFLVLPAEFASRQHYKSSRWQSAIAGTLQACALQKALALGAKHD